MSQKVALERVKQNAELTQQNLKELKNELEIVSKEYNILLAKQLREENQKLLTAVEQAKQRLVQLEISNGVKQIPIPNQEPVITATKPALTHTETTKSQQSEKTEAKLKKEKKTKEPKEKKAADVELPVDIGRLDLRIGKIELVERHPDADSLYVLKINCGEEKPRTVCSGLVKHVPIDELRERSVMLLCNLKPVKMRGITSEAMVMCASSDQGVEVLIPPKDAQPGELVHCDGYTRQPDAIMNPKKKIFETVAPDLHTNEKGEACYKNVPLKLLDKGVFVSKSLKNVPVK